MTRPIMEDTTDERLVALVTGGDKQAYGLIVTRYQNLVCSLAYSACGDFSQSEDLAQEASPSVAWRWAAVQSAGWPPVAWRCTAESRARFVPLPACVPVPENATRALPAGNGHGSGT